MTYTREKKNADAKKYRDRNKNNPSYIDKRRAFSKKCRTKHRYEVLFHYSNGTMQCACCKENCIEFLCIDHINGGGHKHRASVGMYKTNFYYWLTKNGYPEGYRVLCHNCNLSIGFYGYCPHQKLNSIVEQKTNDKVS